MMILAIVAERAAEIAQEFGIDVEEAISRWEEARSVDGGEDAGAWLSVAFMFARQIRLDPYSIR